MGHGTSPGVTSHLLVIVVIVASTIVATATAEYVWKAGRWKECVHEHCGSGGRQYRAVFCGRPGEDNYISVDHSYCSDKPKPPESQGCFKVCPQHHGMLRWRYTVWSDCILDPRFRECSIKHGVHYRNVTCHWQTDGQVVDDRVCSEVAAKPNSEEPCELKCPQDCVVGEFDDWMSCDNCIYFNKTRTRKQIVPPSNGGAKCPDFTEMIPCDNCSETYTFRIGQWDACQTFDDYAKRMQDIHPILGHQKRDIHCINNKGAVVNYEYCMDNLRSSSLSLYNRQTCIIPQDCIVSDWSPMTPLNSSCFRSTDQLRQPGFMIRTRRVLQVPLGSGRTCSDLYHYLKVQASEERPCPRTMWLPTSWSDCSVPQGGFPCMRGLQTRSLICIQEDENKHKKPVSEELCNGARPITARICQAECDLDCIVGHWSTWTECKVTDCELYLRRRRMDEGTGQRFRRRRIISDRNANGERCPHLSQTQTCDPQPCYTWTMTVGDCHLSYPSAYPPCGVGRAPRTLACVNRIGMRVSHGKCEDLEEIPQNWEQCEIPCPNDCTLSPWGPWSACPNLCQEGQRRAPIQTRERTILAQAGPKGKQCPANRQLSQVKSCPTTIECAVYHWQTGPWSRCFLDNDVRACGLGHQTRDVSCYSLQGTLNGDQRCTLSMKPNSSQACEVPCPVDCEVTQFSDWSTCSSSCLDAKQTVPIQTRIRYVIREPKFKGHVCPSKLTETRQCTNLTVCEKFFWDKSPWGPCALPPHMFPNCGLGLQARDVFCTAQNGTLLAKDVCIRNIGPVPDLSRSCLKPCDEECEFEPWSEWSTCIGGCNGSRFRTRKLIEDSRRPASSKCQDQRLYPFDEHEGCLCEKHFPVAIGNWSQCILEPMEAQRAFSAYTHDLIPRGGEEQTPSVGVGVSSVCGQGRAYKVIVCRNDKGEEEDASLCSLQPYKEEECLVPCPVDCVMSDWSLWTDCSTSCGTGTQHRYRHIKQVANDGGRQCPSHDNSGKQTQTRMCSVGCTLHKWRTYKWSPCRPSQHDKACGNGTQSRSVRCEVAFKDGFTNEFVSDRFCFSDPKPHDRQPCYAPCPGECVVNEWEEWTRCKMPCANPNQRQSRTRYVLREPNDDPSFQCPRMLDERVCTSGHNCKEYVWEMSEWTDCLVNQGQAACGKGTKERYPICKEDGRMVSVEKCLMILGEVEDLLSLSCDIQCDSDCMLTEWSSWSKCSEACGLGEQVRTRNVVQQAEGYGRACPLKLSQEKPCFVDGCYTWVVSNWSDCNSIPGVCGHGTQTRNITCMSSSGSPVDSTKCPPDLDVIILQKQKHCTVPCPGECVVAPWSDWNDCFIDCKDYDSQVHGNRGVQSRSRAILAFAQNGNQPCPDQLWESRPCEPDRCYTFNWQTSVWSSEKSREVWCERSDGLRVTGGCSGDLQPGTFLQCNPDCTIPNSYCNNTNYCNCLVQYTPILNRLNALIECRRMDNSTHLVSPTPDSVTLPSDGATNIWMYAVIGAGTLFVIFLAIACYTMSEFFHKGPRPRKKEEDKSLEGAEGTIECMNEQETQFLTRDLVAPVASMSELDRTSIISADRTSSSSSSHAVRALACNGSSATPTHKPLLRFQSDNGPIKDRRPKMANAKYVKPLVSYVSNSGTGHQLSSVYHETDGPGQNPYEKGYKKQNAVLHAPPVYGMPHKCLLHDDSDHCQLVNCCDDSVSGVDVVNYVESRDNTDGMTKLEVVNFTKPRSSSTLNSKSALYATVDKNGNIKSNAGTKTINPVQKPGRHVFTKAFDTEPALCKFTDEVNDTELEIKAGNVLMNGGIVNGPAFESEDIPEDETMNVPKVVYMNRRASPELDESKTEALDSDLYKDILQTVINRSSSSNVNDDDIKGERRKSKVAELMHDADFEQEPLLANEETEDNIQKRRSSLANSKCLSLDHRGKKKKSRHSHKPSTGSSNITEFVYESDDSCGMNFSHSSLRSRMSSLSVSTGPSIHIDPKDAIAQEEASKEGHKRQISAPKRNPNIGFTAFSSIDTETSSPPSTSISCESLHSPRSLPSENDHSMLDNVKTRISDSPSDKSARNVAIDSLRHRHDKELQKQDSGLGLNMDSKGKRRSSKKSKTADLSDLHIRQDSDDIVNRNVIGDLEGHKGENGTESAPLLPPLHFQGIQNKRDSFKKYGGNNSMSISDV